MNYYITELLRMQQRLKQCFKFTLTGIFEKYFGKTIELFFFVHIASSNT